MKVEGELFGKRKGASGREGNKRDKKVKIKNKMCH
jgi:hypothetical protein